MITVTKDGDLWVATIDRQDKANSLTHAMLSDLADTMEAATEARAVILTSAFDAAFSADG